VRKLSRFLLIAAAVIFPGAIFALPASPPVSGTVTISNATLDSVTTTDSQPADANGDILGYVLNFHDSTYEYSLPICSDNNLTEVDGTQISPNAFVAGDILTITAEPGQSTGQECVQTVVRQVISRGPTTGQCLQNFQVTHTIDGSPKTLQPNTPYTYVLTVYARPSFDCDGRAYGSQSITNRVAVGQSFTVGLSEGSNQLTSWTVTTDPKGHASLSYTFPQAGTYTFSVTPTSAVTPGDVIYWTDKPGGGIAAPSPTPSVKPSANKLPIDPVPFAILVIVILVLIGVVESWHWRTKRKRSHELPIDEYLRTPKL
jgi:hypothetical protein